MHERLVVITAPLDRSACLSVAAKLSRLGIPALAHRADTPFPLGMPRFAVSVPLPSARVAAGHVARWGALPPREGAYRTPAAGEEDERPRRRRRLAAFFAFGLAFGFGHVYAREYVAAVILGLGQLACVGLAMSGAAEMLWAFPALVVLDAWGAFRAVDRESAGAGDASPTRAPVAQLAATLPCVALFLASASLMVEPPPRAQAPEASWTSR